MWGRNDKNIEANSSTTVQTSNGAPLFSYGCVKGGGGVNAHFGNTSGTRVSTTVNMFNNTTVSAFVDNISVGVFGVSPTEQSNNRINNSSEKPQHSGWNLRVKGTGYVTSIEQNTSVVYSGYSNNDQIVVTPFGGGANAIITFTTNSSGGNLVFTIQNAGSLFTEKVVPVANLSITNSTYGTASGNTNVSNFTVRCGGRAGRVTYETLIAMKSLGVTNTAFGIPAIDADSSADNTQFPGS